MEASEAGIQICGLGGAVRHLCGGQIAGLPERKDTGWGGGMGQSPLGKGPSGHLIVCCPLFSRVFRQEAPHEAPRVLPFTPPEALAFSSCCSRLYCCLLLVGTLPAQEPHPAAPRQCRAVSFKIHSRFSKVRLHLAVCVDPVLSLSWLVLQCLAPSFSSLVFL